MSEVVNGVNEQDLSSLSMEILDYSERISDLFSKIDLKMESLSDSYKSPSCKEIINSYNSFRSNYAVIKNNLISYSDDLITLINKMNENDKYLSIIYQKLIIDAKSKAKKIEGGAF